MVSIMLVLLIDGHQIINLKRQKVKMFINVSPALK